MGQDVGKNCFAITSKTNKNDVKRLKTNNPPKQGVGEIELETAVELSPVRELPPFDPTKGQLIATMIKQGKSFGQIKRATGYKPGQLKEVLRLFMANTVSNK